MRTNATHSHCFRRMLGLCSALAVMALTVIPGRARADFGDFAWVNNSGYGYGIVHVPSIDQRRAYSADGPILGLPNNGSYYCVPTASMNWLAHIANHGYPQVLPFPNDWQSNNLAVYDSMSTYLSLLGGMMGTDPSVGTTGDAAQNALSSLLDPNLFIVDEVYADQNYSPLFSDLATLAIAGSLVNVSIGWYTNSDLDVVALHQRVGGHLVTLVEANGPAVSNQYPAHMGIHDPAHDTNLFSQSLFTTYTYAIRDDLGFFNSDGNWYLRGQSRVLGYGSGYIDGAIIIVPLYGLAYEGPDFLTLSPIAVFNKENHQVLQSFTSATGGDVEDVALDPINVKNPYLIQGDDKIYELNTVSGDSTVLPISQNSAVQLPAIQHPQRLVMGGRSRDLYVLQPHQITRLSRKGVMDRAVALREPLDAIAYDAYHHLLIGYASRSKTLYAFGEDLRQVSAVPVSQPLCPSDPSRLTLSVQPKTGDLWSHCDGMKDVFHIHWNPSGLPTETRLMLPGLLRPKGLDVDAQGTLFVTDIGHIVAFDSAGHRYEHSPFQGLPGGDRVQIIRAFSNFDPKTMKSPAWYNIPPPGPRL